RLLILFPPGASQIAAHHTFYREWLCFLHEHRASGELLPERLQLFRKLFEIRGYKVIFDVVETLKPKRRNLIEDRALVRNWIGQDDVESRDAVGNDKQERVAKIKDFAHLAAAQFLDSREID